MEAHTRAAEMPIFHNSLIFNALQNGTFRDAKEALWGGGMDLIERRNGLFHDVKEFPIKRNRYRLGKTKKVSWGAESVFMGNNMCSTRKRQELYK